MIFRHLDQLILLNENKFQLPQSRRRREEHKHGIDEVLANYLSWLTDEQKKVIKGLDEHDPELEKKVCLKCVRKTPGRIGKQHALNSTSPGLGILRSDRG